MEQKAEEIFKWARKRIMTVFPGETNNIELNAYCKKAFGSRFKGVYSADTMKILPPNCSCLVNADDSDEPGSHWMAVCRDTSNKIYFYDSFARNPKIILPNLLKVYKNFVINYDTKDVEQKRSQDNCGANSIAYIYVFYALGPKAASKI